MILEKRAQFQLQLTQTVLEKIAFVKSILIIAFSAYQDNAEPRNHVECHCQLARRVWTT